jgi:hypothetical protein
MYEQPSTGRTEVGREEMAGSTTQTTPQGEVEDLMKEAKEKVTETVSSLQVKPMVRHRLDNGMHKAGEKLGAAVHNLNEVAEQLDEHGNSATGNMLRSATEPVQRITDYLEGTSSEQFISDANRYAKEHMWTVIAAGALLGIVASRFVKASLAGSQQRYESMLMQAAPHEERVQSRDAYQGAAYPGAT